LLYDKFVGFLEDMDAIKKSLEKAIDNHGNAMNKLKTGKGNLLTKVEELKKLGAKTQKSIEGGEDVSVLESVLIEN
jgi:DNA recombination protein RmuC